MKTNKHLMISGIIFTIVLWSWPVFMALFQPSGSEEEQLNLIRAHISMYKLQFFNAFLIGPSILYMMLVQLEKCPQKETLSTKLGLIFLTVYLVFVSISYASQIIVVPGLLKAGLMDQAKVWYFGSFTSMAYFLNQLAYFFWGMGALLLFKNLIKRSGIIKYLSLLYMISAILSLGAFIGLILHHQAMNSLTLISGLMLIPTGILTFIWGFREYQMEKQGS